MYDDTFETIAYSHFVCISFWYEIERNILYVGVASSPFPSFTSNSNQGWSQNRNASPCPYVVHGVCIWFTSFCRNQVRESFTNPGDLQITSYGKKIANFTISGQTILKIHTIYGTSNEYRNKSQLSRFWCTKFYNSQIVVHKIQTFTDHAKSCSRLSLKFMDHGNRILKVTIHGTKITKSR